MIYRCPGTVKRRFLKIGESVRKGEKGPRGHSKTADTNINVILNEVKDLYGLYKRFFTALRMTLMAVLWCMERFAYYYVNHLYKRCIYKRSAYLTVQGAKGTRCGLYLRLQKQSFDCSNRMLWVITRCCPGILSGNSEPPLCSPLSGCVCDSCWWRNSRSSPMDP